MQEDPSLRIEKGCVLITEAGNHFGCTDVTTAKAMLIYHHYKKARSKATSLEKELSFEIGFQLYSTAVFGLSYKLCGENLNMREVVEFFVKLGIPPKHPVNYESLVATVQRVQYDIHHLVLDGPYTPGNANKPAEANKFDVAHRFVLCYMDQFFRFPEIQEKIVAVKTTSLKFLNTFYHCPKSMSYKPLELAWAAMHLSFRINLIEIEDIRIVKMELDASVNAQRHQTAMDDLLGVSEVSTRDLEVFYTSMGRPKVN